MIESMLVVAATSLAGILFAYFVVGPLMKWCDRRTCDHGIADPWPCQDVVHEDGSRTESMKCLFCGGFFRRTWVKDARSGLLRIGSIERLN